MLDVKKAVVCSVVQYFFNEYLVDPPMHVLTKSKMSVKTFRAPVEGSEYVLNEKHVVTGFVGGWSPDRGMVEPFCIENDIKDISNGFLL